MEKRGGIHLKGVFFDRSMARVSGDDKCDVCVQFNGEGSRLWPLFVPELRHVKKRLIPVSRGAEFAVPRPGAARQRSPRLAIEHGAVPAFTPILLLGYPLDTSHPWWKGSPLRERS